ncbi:stage III sporulation protein SpoIIIAB [Clostridium algidicarnis]|uniref:stage III sporulation protein SpoIIIAB n=1 Tax=Clostridium algidicarnis TaxID=37659 RepID=UPI001C0B2251|nr:stage III sporulation protein SpoIIIAB [Clostridium algidicarnis]MBU3193815.1 stage III sporulation protein AB [Clostridium algidicarnis]
MVKYFGFLMIIISCSLAGFVYAESLRKRVLELKELERALNHLQNEIFYTHTPLPEALLNISKKGKYGFKDLFKDVATDLKENKVKDVYESFQKNLEKHKKSLNINGEDRNIILDLAKGIGESDIESHMSIFSITLKNLQDQIEIALEKSKKDMKVYRYLGISIGLMTVIFLI